MLLYSRLATTARSHVDLTFLKDLPEYEHVKPYYISGPLPQSLEGSRTNIHYETVRQSCLFNLQGYEYQPLIRECGFELMAVQDELCRPNLSGEIRQQYIHSTWRRTRPGLAAWTRYTHTRSSRPRTWPSATVTWEPSPTPRSGSSGPSMGAACSLGTAPAVPLNEILPLRSQEDRAEFPRHKLDEIEQI
jgi:hypothetical protein